MIRRLRSHDAATAREITPPEGPYGGKGNASGKDPDSSLLTFQPGLPAQPHRGVQPNIPAQKSERERLRRLTREHVKRGNLVPPLTANELRAQAERVCALAGADRIFRDYTAIIVNNESWRDALARIPYDRRLLLLPKCLRAEDRCRAPIDGLGLVCQDCGLCSIHHLQTAAERLGYAVLIAEGSAVVMKMIELGHIEAVVGVSCMSVLERCFPYMEAQAVPGMAVPLLRDGCANTTVDLDWVWEAIHLTCENPTRRLDLEALRRDVQSWFTIASLSAIVGPPDGETEEIARDWLARAGKRWRPYLAACVYLSLERDASGEPPLLSDDLKKLALAVECFHKASLIHDDIEDGDEERYGQQALHLEHGTPVALNVGDFLLGEGYRLIGELGVDDRTKVAMLRTAAAGHLTLSRGQGAELCWARHPEPLSPMEVLDVFRQKTAPAFEVALRLGAFCAGVKEDIHQVLTRYSEALGIAYQIRDDLEDFAGRGDSHDLRGLRPSVVLALAHQRAGGGAEAELTTSLWRRACKYDEVADGMERLIARRGVVESVRDLLEAHAARATRSLHPLKNSTLKGLLRRVISRIFGDVQVQGYCRESEAQHVTGRSVGTEPAG